MRVLGRVLQVAAMVILGVALVLHGLLEENMNAELAWLLVGVAVFLAGYALERRFRAGP